MDRTVATGTGFSGQYRPPVSRLYESLASCPDDLLLFMHHVPYTHVLHDGKTVIQYIYDSHYEGAAAVYESLLGNTGEARERAMAALALSGSRDVEYAAAFAQSGSGGVAQSQTLAKDLERRRE